jgi:hypothetical protein
MKPTPLSNGKGLRFGLLAALGGLLLLGGWRELSWRGCRQQQEIAQADLALRLDATDSELAAEREQRKRLESASAEQLIRLESLQDRASNLAAQRDHLRAEVERRVEETRLARQAAAALETQLEEARLAAFEAGQLPSALQAQLDLAQKRIEDLEGQLDSSSERLAHSAPALILEGISSDQRAFALSGRLPETFSLPGGILLCRGDEILMEGWLHRREGATLIGHSAHWRVDASTLVKGEKVFILREDIYEADH